MGMYRSITPDEFKALKPGDEVYAKWSGHYHLSTVISEPIWNSDADEPDWEVETSNGWSDMYSLYLR